MNVMAWLIRSKVVAEKEQLKADLTQSIMKFERRRTEVERVADDVMKLMHGRSGRSEKN